MFDDFPISYGFYALIIISELIINLLIRDLRDTKISQDFLSRRDIKVSYLGVETRDMSRTVMGIETSRDF